MKDSHLKIFKYKIFCAAFFLTINCQGFTQNLDDGLLIYYPLNGNVQDQSTNGFNGINVGAIPSEDRNDMQNGSMLFENGAYIDFPNQTALQPDFPFSFSFWFMATEYDEDQNYSLVSTDMTLDAYYGAFITINKNTHILSAGFGDGSGSTSVEYRFGKVSGESILLNKWYHLVVVFKSPFDIIIYLDGFKIPLCQSGTGNPQMQYNNVAGSLGRNDHSSIYGNNLSFFTGKMDEFKFWNRILTDDDVELLYPVFDLEQVVEICEDEAITLSMPNKEVYNYEWNTGENTYSIQVKDSGTYIVNIEINGCKTSDTTKVIVTDFFDLDLGNDLIICDNTIVNLTGPSSNDLNYSWSTGENSQSIEVDKSGFYILTIDDDNCQTSDTISITVDSSLKIDLGEDFKLCNDDVFVLSGFVNDNFSYMWNTNENLSEILIEQAGTYIITATNDYCNLSDTIIVEQASTNLSLGEDVQFCNLLDDPIELQAANNYENYLWSTGQTSVSITVTEIGNYWLTVKDINGCFSTDTISILNKCESKLFIPNAFSPNDDGINDVFKPVGIADTGYLLKIYNRYGQQVFHTTDINLGWKGFYNDKKQPIGVYVWLMRYTDFDNVYHQLKGDLTLIR